MNEAHTPVARTGLSDRVRRIELAQRVLRRDVQRFAALVLSLWVLLLIALLRVLLSH